MVEYHRVRRGEQRSGFGYGYGYGMEEVVTTEVQGMYKYVVDLYHYSVTTSISSQLEA